MKEPIKEAIKAHLELLKEATGKMIDNTPKLLQAFQTYLVENSTTIDEDGALMALKGADGVPGLLWYCSQPDRWFKGALSKSALLAFEILTSIVRSPKTQVFLRAFWNLELDDFRKLELGRQILQSGTNNHSAFNIVRQVQTALNFHSNTAALHDFITDQKAIDLYTAWAWDQADVLASAIVPDDLVSKPEAFLRQLYPK